MYRESNRGSYRSTASHVQHALGGGNVQGGGDVQELKRLLAVPVQTRGPQDNARRHGWCMVTQGEFALAVRDVLNCESVEDTANWPPAVPPPAGLQRRGPWLLASSASALSLWHCIKDHMSLAKFDVTAAYLHSDLAACRCATAHGALPGTGGLRRSGCGGEGDRRIHACGRARTPPHTGWRGLEKVFCYKTTQRAGVTERAGAADGRGSSTTRRAS